MKRISCYYVESQFKNFEHFITRSNYKVYYDKMAANFTRSEIYMYLYDDPLVYGYIDIHLFPRPTYLFYTQQGDEKQKGSRQSRDEHLSYIWIVKSSSRKKEHREQTPSDGCVAILDVCIFGLYLIGF